MKTICFLSSLRAPRDKRVFDKEARSLALEGYKVIHLAPGNEPCREENGVSLQMFPPVRGIKGRILNLMKLFFRARALKADLYHCNEVDSWIIGLMIKIFQKTKVVFDVHEYYPGDFSENYFPGWFRAIPSGSIKFLYRLLTPFTDYLIFAKRSVAIDFPSSENRHAFIFNYSRLNVTGRKREDVPAGIRGLFDGKITAVHFGLFNRKRGWPQLLEAMKQINVQNFQLLVIGTIDDGSKKEFFGTADRYGLKDKIIYREWLPYGEAYDYLLCCQIGLILFQPGILSHVYAFPHKLFDYMLAGMPVIYPEFSEELACVVRKENCGILVDTSNPLEIGKAIETLSWNDSTREKMGRNGRSAVIEKYNWENEARKLSAVYSHL